MCLQSIKLRRLDGVEEDDFKTWAQCSIVRSDTLIGVDFWYNQDDNLSKTSVRAMIYGIMDGTLRKRTTPSE